MSERTITQICEDYLDHPELLKGCNLFVQAVCAELGYGPVFAKGDNADAMIEKFSKKPFQLIGTDKDKATALANGGQLVLAGLSKAGMTYTNKQGVSIQASMGHVVVVVPGGPSLPTTIKLADGSQQSCRGGYPLCYGGAAVPKYRIKARLSIDSVFHWKVLKDVIYAYLAVPKHG